MGAFYGLCAIGLGLLFVYKSWQLLQVPDDLVMAKSVFKYSIFYMMLLCVGMVIDSLPVTQAMVAHLQVTCQTAWQIAEQTVLGVLV
jgi:heme o synthase